jgi:hypothetical protein
MKKYQVGLSVFNSFEKALAHYNMMFAISGVILGIVEVK